MNNNAKYDALKLENQLCFPLYACSKEIIKKYKPFLDEINLNLVAVSFLVCFLKSLRLRFPHLQNRKK